MLLAAFVVPPVCFPPLCTVLNNGIGAQGCKIPARLLSVAARDPTYKGTDEALPDSTGPVRKRVPRCGAVLCSLSDIARFVD